MNQLTDTGAVTDGLRDAITDLFGNPPADDPRQEAADFYQKMLTLSLHVALSAGATERDALDMAIEFADSVGPGLESWLAAEREKTLAAAS